MCGIVGYIGKREALGFLLEGLKNLEYRGYDSSGVALISSGEPRVVIRKEQGKIRELEALIAQQPVPSAFLGIAHTRWATHGAPCRRNSHPHSNADETIAVVHNGIIENYQSLRTSLVRKGYKFVSDTDTEVVVHLIAQYFQGDLVQAVRQAIRELKGAFAFGVVSSKDPSLLVAARVGSPLVIGVGNGENFIASDVPAILKYTRRVIYLKDGEMAVLRKNGVEVTSFDGRKVPCKIATVTFKMDAAQKQGYAHFMLKEIHEQPEVLSRIFSGRIKAGRVVLEGLGLTDKALKAFDRIKIVACGTAYHAGLAGR